MQRDLEAFRVEILGAVDEIGQFVVGKTFDTYRTDAKTKAAVERKLMIIGEALSQIKKYFPPVISGIRDADKIVAFRNILVHAYFGIDDKIVWDVVANKLDNLHSDIRALK